jgi:hypothetical protein
LIPVWLKFLKFIYAKFLLHSADNIKAYKKLFFLSCFLLWIVNGILVPSNLIATSTQEFATIGAIQNPLTYVQHSALVFFGIFVFWPIAIFYLSPQKIKIGETLLFFVLSFSSLLNVFIFKSDYGVINPLLIFENVMLLKSSIPIALGSLGGLLLFFVLSLHLMGKGKTHLLNAVGTIAVIAAFASSSWSMITIQKDYKEFLILLDSDPQNVVLGNELQPVIELSRSGKNVIILMLDRAINSYFPLIVNEFPELEEQFDGFVYYPNTVSFGSGTLTGSPALMGGYEYSPRRINERADEQLVDKHNEAILVLPRIFSETGYHTVVTDPPFSNYAWSGDFRPFLPYPEIETKHLHGMYTLRYKQDHAKEFEGSEDPRRIVENRLPVYSLMIAAWPGLRELMYDGGNYLSASNIKSNFDEFLSSYAQLYYLNEITSYENDGNTFYFIDNEATHEPVILGYPEFSPTNYIDDIYNPFEGILGIDERDIGTYHVNVASLKRIGIWLETLKNDGMYDNTRIIIVADHGRDVYTEAFSGFNKNSRVYGDYHPLLLVKDFNSEGSLITNREFMTNADTPILALQGLPIEPNNPFTGNNIFSEVDKEDVEVFKGPWAANPNLGNIFDFDYNRSFTVSEDIFEESNWSPIEER